MSLIQKHLAKLGHTAKDRVTGIKGVITSVSFDLYGCVQAILHPGLDKEGKMADSVWIDIARLKITSEKPVMEVPDFVEGKQAEGRQGPAEKPRAFKA